VAVAQRVEVNLIDVNLNPVDKVNPVAVQPPVAPPSMLKRTIQFAPYAVVKDNEVTQYSATQDELTNSQAQISVATVDVPPGGTVDIRDVPKVTDAPAKDDIFVHVEQMPTPQGGEAELMKWLSSNIVYPTIAIEQGIYGTVVLKFVVRTDGSIDDVQIVKSLDPSCDKEAIRVVKKMPHWIPGRQNGTAVNVYFNLPIQFKLKNQ